MEARGTGIAASLRTDIVTLCFVQKDRRQDGFVTRFEGGRDWAYARRERQTKP